MLRLLTVGRVLRSAVVASAASSCLLTGGWWPLGWLSSGGTSTAWQAATRGRRRTDCGGRGRLAMVAGSASTMGSLGA
jgi:hypothetical protein